MEGIADCVQACTQVGSYAIMNNVYDNSALEKRLSEFPRVSEYDEHTPIESLHNLSKACGGTRLFIKRDDCNGLAFGGNKVRQAEYYFGDAVRAGADTVLITGAIQSNFARITAALAAKLGMECHVQLESRVPNPSENYTSSGNVLLNRMFGAKLHCFPEGENEQGADTRIRSIAEELKSTGRKPYVIPLAPGHKPLGALGYVRAAIEIVKQLQDRQISIDEIFVASGSGNTHAGLLFGLQALNSAIRVVGVCVRRSKELQFSRIRDCCTEISELLNIDLKVDDEDIVLTDNFLAPGYGKASQEVWESIIFSAQKEGLVLDPTYTGKTMSAFLEFAKSAPSNANLMFLHTGGTPSLFAYQKELENFLSETGGKFLGSS